jgi:hypothetical protein
VCVGACGREAVYVCVHIWTLIRHTEYILSSHLRISNRSKLIGISFPS